MLSEFVLSEWYLSHTSTLVRVFVFAVLLSVFWRVRINFLSNLPFSILTILVFVSGSAWMINGRDYEITSKERYLMMGSESKCDRGKCDVILLPIDIYSPIVSASDIPISYLSSAPPNGCANVIFAQNWIKRQLVVAPC